MLLTRPLSRACALGITGRSAPVLVAWPLSRACATGHACRAYKDVSSHARISDTRMLLHILGCTCGAHFCGTFFSVPSVSFLKVLKQFKNFQKSISDFSTKRGSNVRILPRSAFWSTFWVLFPFYNFSKILKKFFKTQTENASQ